MIKNHICLKKKILFSQSKQIQLKNLGLILIKLL